MEWHQRERQSLEKVQPGNWWWEITGVGQEVQISKLSEGVREGRGRETGTNKKGVGLKYGTANAE